jgi:drug/metabolite transporter (DMT)-like permease
MKRRFSSRGTWAAALSSRAALIAFVLFVLFGGTNGVAIRFSNHELPPFWGAAIRFGAAALIFWIIVLGRRIALPTGRALLGTVLYGLVAVGAFYALVYWALVRVQAGMGSVFLAFVPLVTLFLATAHGLEAVSWRRVSGALIAVVGILVVVGGGLGTTLYLPSLLALVAAVVCVSEGAVIFKFLPRADAMATNAVAFTTGALMLAGLSFLAGEEWRLPAAANTWAAFLYLVVVGSVLVFYLQLFVLARWPASRAAYGFVLLPVVSVAVSAWLTGEVITPSFAVGAAVVLVGIWVGAINGSSRATAPEPVPTPGCVTC